MSKTSDAADEIRSIEKMTEKDQWMNRIHPLVKLCTTIYYILLVMSFPKYQLSSLLSMILYLIILFILGEIPFMHSMRRLKLVLPFVCITGILNPFFDHTPVITCKSFVITGGMISMITLMTKGVFAVLSAYLLIITTSMPKICAALRMLHVPKLLVTVILLICRYLLLLLDEAGRITQAYALRAPKQKGIRFQAWGSLAGLLLLRTMDRAQNVYDSMCLRGFHGEFYYEECQRLRLTDISYLAAWIFFLTMLRFVPLFELTGSLIFK